MRFLKTPRHYDVGRTVEEGDVDITRDGIDKILYSKSDGIPTWSDVKYLRNEYPDELLLKHDVKGENTFTRVVIESLPNRIPLDIEQEGNVITDLNLEKNLKVVFVS